MDQLRSQLGKVLTAQQVAEYLNLDIKTVHKYYREFGGIRVGARYKFFERLFIHAVQKKSEVVRSSPEGGAETRKSVCDKKASNGLGGRYAKKTLKRVVREDRHRLY